MLREAVTLILGEDFFMCCASMTFWYGSGSTDQYPAIFVIDLRDAYKKLIFLKRFSAHYFLKVHLDHFSEIKSQKEVTKQ
jgi:hypothetical protein